MRDKFRLLETNFASVRYKLSVQRKKWIEANNKIKTLKKIFPLTSHGYIWFKADSLLHKETVTQEEDYISGEVGFVRMKSRTVTVYETMLLLLELKFYILRVKSQNTFTCILGGQLSYKCQLQTSRKTVRMTTIARVLPIPLSGRVYVYLFKNHIFLPFPSKKYFFLKWSVNFYSSCTSFLP